MGSDSSMHLNPGLLKCISIKTAVDLFFIYFLFCFLCLAHHILVCVCRSVRPRLTLYVCQESPQESPLVERHSSSENGEHGISSSLHGTDWNSLYSVKWVKHVCECCEFKTCPVVFLCSVSRSVPRGADSCRTDPQDGVCVQPSTGKDQPGVQTGSYRHTHPT